MWKVPSSFNRACNWALGACLFLTLAGCAGSVPAPSTDEGPNESFIDADGCPLPATSSYPKNGWNDAAHHARDHGFLWRIEKDGHTSWIYGTIHVARAEWMLPGPAVEAALRQSDTIALELDLLDKQVATNVLALQTGTTGGADQQLDQERSERLARLMKAACLTGDLSKRLNTLRPRMRVTALGVLSGRADGLYPDFGIDMFLTAFGRSSSKAVVGLETPADQIAPSTSRTLQRQELEQLDTALDQLESGQTRRRINDIAQVWSSSDVEKLAHYADWCDCWKTPAQQVAMKRLIDDRNVGMAKGIDRLHQSGKSVFSAVGLLHMVGSNGLPTLLAQRGFSVTRILPKITASGSE